MFNYFRHQDFLLALGAVIILVVAGLVLIWWVGGEKAQLVADNQALAAVRDQSDQAAGLTALAKQTVSARAALNAYFVNQNTAANFIGQLEALAKQVGVTLKVNQAVVSQAGLEFNLYAEGKFSALFNLTQLLVVMPFNTKLIKISLIQSKGWSAAINLTLASYQP